MQEATFPSDYWRMSDVDFPELERAKNITQRNDQTVFEHTMSVIDVLQEKNPITLLSGLFHDLGKCLVSSVRDMSGPRFPGHDFQSAMIATNVLQSWGLNSSSHLVDRVVSIVAVK